MKGSDAVTDAVMRSMYLHHLDRDAATTYDDKNGLMRLMRSMRSTSGDAMHTHTDRPLRRGAEGGARGAGSRGRIEGAEGGARGAGSGGPRPDRGDRGRAVRRDRRGTSRGSHASPFTRTGWSYAFTHPGHTHTSKSNRIDRINRIRGRFDPRKPKNFFHFNDVSTLLNHRVCKHIGPSRARTGGPVRTPAILMRSLPASRPHQGAEYPHQRPLEAQNWRSPPWLA